MITPVGPQGITIGNVSVPALNVGLQGRPVDPTPALHTAGIMMNRLRLEEMQYQYDTELRLKMFEDQRAVARERSKAMGADAGGNYGLRPDLYSKDANLFNELSQKEEETQRKMYESMQSVTGSGRIDPTKYIRDAENSAKEFERFMFNNPKYREQVAINSERATLAKRIAEAEKRGIGVDYTTINTIDEQLLAYKNDTTGEAMFNPDLLRAEGIFFDTKAAAESAEQILERVGLRDKVAKVVPLTEVFEGVYQGPDVPVQVTEESYMAMDEAVLAAQQAAAADPNLSVMLRSMGMTPEQWAQDNVNSIIRDEQARITEMKVLDKFIPKEGRSTSGGSGRSGSSRSSRSTDDGLTGMYGAGGRFEKKGEADLFDLDVSLLNLDKTKKWRVTKDMVRTADLLRQDEDSPFFNKSPMSFIKINPETGDVTFEIKTSKRGVDGDVTNTISEYIGKAGSYAASMGESGVPFTYQDTAVAPAGGDSFTVYADPITGVPFENIIGGEQRGGFNAESVKNTTDLTKATGIYSVGDMRGTAWSFGRAQLNGSNMDNFFRYLEKNQGFDLPNDFQSRYTAVNGKENATRILDLIDKAVDQLGGIDAYKSAEQQYVINNIWGPKMNNFKSKLGRELTVGESWVVADAINKHGGVTDGVFAPAFQSLASKGIDAPTPEEVINAITDARVDYVTKLNQDGRFNDADYKAAVGTNGTGGVYNKTRRQAIAVANQGMDVLDSATQQLANEGNYFDLQLGTEALTIPASQIGGQPTAAVGPRAQPQSAPTTMPSAADIPKVALANFRTDDGNATIKTIMSTKLSDMAILTKLPIYPDSDIFGTDNNTSPANLLQAVVNAEDKLHTESFKLKAVGIKDTNKDKTLTEYIAAEKARIRKLPDNEKSEALKKLNTQEQKHKDDYRKRIDQTREHLDSNPEFKAVTTIASAPPELLTAAVVQGSSAIQKLPDGDLDVRGFTPKGSANVWFIVSDNGKYKIETEDNDAINAKVKDVRYGDIGAAAAAVLFNDPIAFASYIDEVATKQKPPATVNKVEATAPTKKTSISALELLKPR